MYVKGAACSAEPTDYYHQTLQQLQQAVIFTNKSTQNSLYASYPAPNGRQTIAENQENLADMFGYRVGGDKKKTKLKGE